MSGQNGLSIDPTNFVGSIVGKYDPVIGAKFGHRSRCDARRGGWSVDGDPFELHAVVMWAMIATAPPLDRALIGGSYPVEGGPGV